MKKILVVTSILSISVAGNYKIMAMDKLDPAVVYKLVSDTYTQRAIVTGEKEQDELNLAIAVSRSDNEAARKEKKDFKKTLTDSRKEYSAFLGKNSADPGNDDEDSLEDKINVAKGKVASLKDSRDRFSSFTGNDPQLEAAEKEREALIKAKRRQDGDFDPEQVKKQKERIDFYNKSRENSPGFQRKTVSHYSRIEPENITDADSEMQKAIYESLTPPRPVKNLNPATFNPDNSKKNIIQKEKLFVPENSDQLFSSGTLSPRKRFIVSHKGNRSRKGSPNKSPTSTDSLSPAPSWEKLASETTDVLPSQLSDSVFAKVFESNIPLPQIAVTGDSGDKSSFQGDYDNLMNKYLNGESENEENSKGVVLSSPPINDEEIILTRFTSSLQIDYRYYQTNFLFIPVAQKPVFFKADVSQWKNINDDSVIPVSQLFLSSCKFTSTPNNKITKMKMENDEEHYMVSKIFNSVKHKSSYFDNQERLWINIGIPTMFEKIPPRYSAEKISTLKADDPNFFFQEDSAQSIEIIKKFFNGISVEDSSTLFARLISFKRASEEAAY